MTDELSHERPAPTQPPSPPRMLPSRHTRRAVSGFSIYQDHASPPNRNNHGLANRTDCWPLQIRAGSGLPVLQERNAPHGYESRGTLAGAA
jgi:hypothetical protein